MHLDFRPFPEQVVSQATPAHARHHDISDEQVNRVALLLESANRLGAIGGFQYGVAIFLQNMAGQGSHALFIFRQEDRLRLKKRESRRGRTP
jgi:hypothetical protein